MSHLIRRSMVWRLLAVGAVVLVTGGAQTRCSSGDLSQLPPPGPDGSGNGPTFTTTLVLRDSAGVARSTFQAGELITFELSVRNRSSQPVEVDFRSGQQYDFFAFRSGTAEVAWRWSSGALFTQAQTRLEFAAGETRVFTVQWTQGAAGTYEARGAILFDALAANPQAPHELGSTLVPFTIN